MELYVQFLDFNDLDLYLKDHKNYKSAYNLLQSGQYNFDYLILQLNLVLIT